MLIVNLINTSTKLFLFENTTAYKMQSHYEEENI